MVDGACANLSKLILVIVNVLLWLLGCALIGVGAYSEVQRTSHERITIIGSDVSRFGPIALIVGGVLIFVVGLAGCWGAVKERRKLLILYAILMTIIFALEIAAGVYGFIERDNLENFVTDGMGETLNKYDPREESKTETKSWDVVQRDVKCCGIRNYTDWDNATVWSQFSTLAGKYPSSCCVGGTNATASSVLIEVCDSTAVYPNGCYDESLSELRMYWRLIAGIALGVAVLQMLVIIMACCLASAVDDDGKYV